VRYQKTPYHCGPASVQNALAVLGTKASQDRLALAAGTTEEHGTDEEGIKRAIAAAGRTYDEHATDVDSLAYGWLWYSLVVGRPVVLCVDRWAHWVCAVGVLGKRVVLFDPARYRHNTDRLGTFALPKEKLLKRWKAAHRVARSEPAYFGIAIGGRL
jgi:predicted double-glycine peptidase